MFNPKSPSGAKSSKATSKNKHSTDSSSGSIEPMRVERVKRETSHFQPHQFYPHTFSQTLYWKAIKHPEKTGWLKKRGLINVEWIRRFFTLCGDYLFYARAPTAWHCKGRIYLHPHYTAIERFEDAPPLTEKAQKWSEKRCIFVIQTRGIKELKGVMRRSYFIQASNEEEREEWFAIVYRAIHGPHAKVPEPRLKAGAFDEISHEQLSFSDDEDFDEEFIADLGDIPSDDHFDSHLGEGEHDEFLLVPRRDERSSTVSSLGSSGDEESESAVDGTAAAPRDVVVLPQEEEYMDAVKTKLRKHKIKKCRKIDPLVVGTIDGMMKAYFTPEKLVRPDGSYKLKVKLQLVHTGIWRWTPGLVKDVISPNMAEYGLVHAALQFGPYLLDWNISSLITPRPIKSGMQPLLLAEFKTGGLVYRGRQWDRVEEVCRRICHVSVRWNQRKHYARTGHGHCHHYVNDVLDVLGITAEFDEPLQTFVDHLRKHGTSSMKYTFPLTGEKTTFVSHKQLDDFCKWVLATEPSFPMEYSGDWQLLKAFDRAFWAHSSKSHGEPYQPKGRECPFNDPRDALQGSFFGQTDSVGGDAPPMYGVEH